MLMFVRNWGLMRSRIRILFYKFIYFCYNTDKKERLMAFFYRAWDSESQVGQSKQVALSLSEELSKVK